jgi:hypothetical protein
VARDGDEDRVDALLAALWHQHDDELAAASSRARRQRHWSHQLAAESATLAGALLTLAEHEAAVTVRCGPWAHGGRLRSVTATLAIVECADGMALLPIDAITAVEAATAVVDDRTPASGPDLAALLAALAGERPVVRMELADGAEVAGRLVGVGKDAASLELTSANAIVRLSAIAGCIVLGRGTSTRPRCP